MGSKILKKNTKCFSQPPGGPICPGSLPPVAPPGVVKGRRQVPLSLTFQKDKEDPPTRLARVCRSGAPAREC